MVFASQAVLSDSRFAARPVGAARATFTPLTTRIFRIELTRVVLPTPGPPVMTRTFDRSASRTASRGARSLNIDLQQALNPPGEMRVERFGSTYGIGDKVMQVENDYDKEVYNGDLGVVRSIDPEASEMVIDFDGREVTYGFGELDELVLAYATTIHKSQGSEYPAVVIPLTTQHYPMLQRNLLYTAVTRGKRLVVIIGQKKALAIAVKGKQTGRRWSKLRECLHEPAR